MCLGNGVFYSLVSGFIFLLMGVVLLLKTSHPRKDGRSRQNRRQHPFYYVYHQRLHKILCSVISIIGIRFRDFVLSICLEVGNGYVPSKHLQVVELFNFLASLK